MKIEEVATQFSISSPTLRYYEHEGLLAPLNVPTASVTIPIVTLSA
ncbi:MerR family DNA-binding transcriptional regulator [Pediococcus pentosaceus]